ncbi:aminoglycoside phosphotransferase [Nonomuraea sp. NN258]|uniref:fructosamine kinase family protein n=1 Tax=Nonomuraea antri TaxID=2730852 RepID=UPI0015690B8E|nr:fructosamine kinase family protein [Nonomuraea antri]NRQ37410.1 aminoglycoside phosphotransferase [Nonomuraea antri]
MSDIAALADGCHIFAKTLDLPDPHMFEAEAEGLRALSRLDGVVTPQVLAVSAASARARGDAAKPRTRQPLLGAARPQHRPTAPDGCQRPFRLAPRRLAGRLRQDNTWDTDGHALFARQRILRRLPEAAVEAVLDQEQRRAIERLCGALPDLVPGLPAVLTHGDLWPGQHRRPSQRASRADRPGRLYTRAEVDVGALWCSTTRPPAADRFFPAYAEAAPLACGWRERAPILYLREHLSSIAHGLDVAGSVRHVQAVIGLLRRRSWSLRRKHHEADGNVLLRGSHFYEDKNQPPGTHLTDTTCPNPTAGCHTWSSQTDRTSTAPQTIPATSSEPSPSTPPRHRR